MAKFHKMVDMSRTPAEKVEEAVEMMAPPAMSIPDVPYGLCISFSEVELEKLGLDADCSVGDMIHVFAMGTVTSVSKSDHGSGPSARVEISLTHIGVEDEDDEEESD
jgi:hypothetical protein